MLLAAGLSRRLTRNGGQHHAGRRNPTEDHWHADEAGEASIPDDSKRARLVEVEGIDRLGDDNAIKTLLNKDKQFGEAVISFALAAILELVPMPSLADDARKRLAYNLRVRTYEKLEDLVIRATPFIRYVEGATERAMELANGSAIGTLVERATRLGEEYLKPHDQSVSEASEEERRLKRGSLDGLGYDLKRAQGSDDTCRCWSTSELGDVAFALSPSQRGGVVCQ